MSASKGIPRRPLLQPANLLRGNSARTASCMELPHRVYVPSGRAAIYWALRAMSVPIGAKVLLPSYHCPTMVAPVVRASCEPVFYPLLDDGSPDLDGVPRGVRPRAILVPHLFDRPTDMSAVRRWCDERGVALIEDCAHCLYGIAGSRSVGSWGDFAVASLTKFLPVSSVGLLGSSTKDLGGIALSRLKALDQVKAAVNILEESAAYGRLGAFGTIGLMPLRGIQWLRRHGGELSREKVAGICGEAHSKSAIRSRAEQFETGPAVVDRWLINALGNDSSLQARRRSYLRIASAVDASSNAHLLFGPLPLDSHVPYVVPIYVLDGDRVYARLRELRFPVFRWDDVWPGTPDCGGVAADWSRHVLQVSCHQSLTESDLEEMLVLLTEALAG